MRACSLRMFFRTRSNRSKTPWFRLQATKAGWTDVPTRSPCSSMMCALGTIDPCSLLCLLTEQWSRIVHWEDQLPRSSKTGFFRWCHASGSLALLGTACPSLWSIQRPYLFDLVGETRPQPFAWTWWIWLCKCTWRKDCCADSQYWMKYSVRLNGAYSYCTAGVVHRKNTINIKSMVC